MSNALVAANDEIHLVDIADFILKTNLKLPSFNYGTEFNFALL